MCCFSLAPSVSCSVSGSKFLCVRSLYMSLSLFAFLDYRVSVTVLFLCFLCVCLLSLSLHLFLYLSLPLASGPVRCGVRLEAPQAA